MSQSNPESRDDLIDVREVAPAEVAEIDLYQRREKIYTRKIEGFFQRVRLFTGWPLLLGYFLLPWFQFEGRQAVWFDLPARKFHILGLTLWPQDLPLLAWLLIIAAFALFAVTTLAGRIWCGYTCPQTVWTTIFMWIEQKFEGSRNQRIKLDKAPWSIKKLVKKSLKHAGWFFVAFATGMTFVGYFYPIRDLAWELMTASSGQWQYLWTLFFTLATYINAGWMREQVCMYMCPYARFQSVMFDHNTLIVSYDEARGEQRGSRKRNADPVALGLGNCIDCELCVQVCPTGIDIRDGLQYQCIGCALCVDACNSVMAKMDYPSGLIRYTSEAELQGDRTHWLRPRIIGYFLAVFLMVCVFSAYVLFRVPLEMTVIRDRNQLYIMNNAGEVENIYSLHLLNMDSAMHEFEISFSGLDSARIIGNTLYTLDGGAGETITLRIAADPAILSQVSSKIEFSARATDADNLRTISESRFLKPME